MAADFREVAACSGVDENLPATIDGLSPQADAIEMQKLMHVHHTGKKIPYSAMTKFNYGYRR